jgi:PD-(D/E)XK nuclease superfamily
VTADILRVSVTELQEYWRCERMWDTESANRQSLVRKGKPPTALWMGSAIHVALAAQIGGANPFEALDEYVDELRTDIAKDYIEQVGVPMSQVEWDEFNKSYVLARDCVRNYFYHYGREPHLPDRAVASELTFVIPLGPMGSYVMVHLVGTIDAVLIAPSGDIIIVDHKSFSQRPDLRDLQYDHQFTGYGACIQHLIHQPVAGFLYNGINKKVPGIPRKLVGEGPTKGKLSREWIDTTYPVYRQAIIDNGEDPDKDPYYTAILGRLRERDRVANPFFVRHYLHLKQAAMASWWDNMLTTVSRMADLERPLTYNRVWQGCWDCGVRDICDAMIDGANVDWVKRNYRIGTYGTQRTLANTISPATVNSLDDLIRVMSQGRPHE